MDESQAHSISLVNRKQLVIEGVQHVGSFDDSEITLDTNMGAVILKGRDLHITQLSLEKGTISVEGLIISLQYVEAKSRERSGARGILQRLLK